MERPTSGVDPKKFEVVQTCLRVYLFEDIKLDAFNHRFVFNYGEQTSELVFARAFLEDIHIDRIEQLEVHMLTKIIPTLKTNAGKRITVSKTGIIDVSERELT